MKTCENCMCCRPDPKRKLRKMAKTVVHKDGTSHEWGHCVYPLHGEAIGGGTIWVGKKACSYYEEAPPEQLEFATLLLNAVRENTKAIDKPKKN